MNYFFLDASAWVKRFHQEPGSDIVNSLVDRLLPTSPQRLAISPLGLAEVIAALNRQKNEGRLPSQLFRQATVRILLEAKDMDSQPLDEEVVMESLSYISKHNINSSDALSARPLLTTADGQEAADQRYPIRVFLLIRGSARPLLTTADGQEAADQWRQTRVAEDCRGSGYLLCLIA